VVAETPPPTRKDLGVGSPTEGEIRTVAERAQYQAFQKFGMTLFSTDQLELLVRESLDGFVSTSEAERLQQEAATSVEEQHADELQERFQAGKDAMRVKSRQVAEAVDVLTDARGLVKDALAWSGPPERRDELIRRIDELLAKLQS
jgi:hypothetical protein